jgi:hypothetical protein
MRFKGNSGKAVWDPNISTLDIHTERYVRCEQADMRRHIARADMVTNEHQTSEKASLNEERRHQEMLWRFTPEEGFPFDQVFQ